MNRFLALTIFLFCLVQLSLQQEECSATKLCPEGCCSSAGHCGYGPDFCGKGCQSTCDRKSECNPGWKSDEFSEHDSCPLNVCCSKHGWCGYTEEFCEDDKVDRPSCSASKEVSRVIGYYEAWAPSKRSKYSMLPEEIPYGQYTDIIFSFATINPTTFKVSAGDDQTENFMSRISAIKLVQPDIKIWVALGGWAFNDPGPTQTTFSDIARSKANTNTFLDSLVQMMNKYGFDGVDIDWEYPVADDRHGRPEDYENAVTFMKAIKNRMKDSKRGVSMAIPASYWYLQNFDIKALEAQVDWFNIMSYDVHGSWDIDNKWTGPWVNSHTNMTEIQMALDLLWRNDISPKKVTMGMAFYSRSFTLTDPNCSGLGCRVSSGGNAGKYSDTVGVLLHPEIQEIISEKKLTPTLDRKGAVKLVHWDDQWVSFDDVATWRLKANVARSQCIEGFMVWAMSQDDDKGTNIKGLNQALGRKTPDFPDFTPVDKPTPEPQPALAPELCRWTSCFEGCPSGFKEVQRDGHKEIMMDANICNEQGLGFSRFCCPSSHTLPTCTWRGHRNSGKCKPGCEAGEVEVGSLSLGCKKNYQSACCTSSDVTAAYGECLWTDCMDYEEAKSTCKHTMATSAQGWGGHKSCKSGKTRALCCAEPLPAPFATTCKWVPKNGFLKGDGIENICEGACPQDSVKLALSLGFHTVPGRKTACYGYNAFCCSDPTYNVPRDNDDDWEDPFGSMQAREFKLLLEKYMENPTCPATILEPPIHDQYGGMSIAKKKRNLIAEAHQYDILQGRATDCTQTNWDKMLSYAALMFTMREVGFDIFRRFYNDKFAGHYHEALEFDNLDHFLEERPNIDRRAQLEYVFLNPLDAGQGMREIENTDTALCMLPSSRTNSKRELLATTGGEDAAKRAVWVGQSSRSDIPNVETILQGILDGDLSLHYARWQWVRNEGSGNAAGPMLELAYWIGPEPGSDTTDDSNYNVYRDMRPRARGVGPDQWVVFHMHVETTDPDWLWAHPNGHTYMGVPGFRVFHGQEVAEASEEEGQWRVQGGGHTAPTVRHGWDCPEDTGYWYVGRPADEPEPRLAMLLHLWGQRLWRDGYASRMAQRVIVEPPRGGSREAELDPANPGYVVRPPRGWTTVVGEGVNPYHVSFLIDGNNYVQAPGYPGEPPAGPAPQVPPGWEPPPWKR